MKTKKIDRSILHDNQNKPLMPNEVDTVHKKRIFIMILWSVIALASLVAMILVLVLVKKSN